MLGARSLPNGPSGIEAHCRHLLAVISRRPPVAAVVNQGPLHQRRDLPYRVVRVSSLRRKGLDKPTTLLAALPWLLMRRPSLVHLHGSGIAPFIAVLRMLGFAVVYTQHSQDAQHGKWGLAARIVIGLGVHSQRFAHRVIAVSPDIAAACLRAGVLSHRLAVLPNGVGVEPHPDSDGVLQRFGLTNRPFLIAACRISPEKNLEEMLAGFAVVSRTHPELRLVIAGAAPDGDAYAAAVVARARNSPGVIVTGLLPAAELHALMSQAVCLIQTSRIEGLPIAPLEALSLARPVILSDISAHRQFEQVPPSWRYSPGNIAGLASCITSHVRNPPAPSLLASLSAHTRQSYDWRIIAAATVRVYLGALTARHQLD
jgi:glycosyltransferase involved in cell wall biosynthesis